MKTMPISRIRRFLELPQDHLVRLYTYQTPATYKEAQERGYWTGDINRIMGGDSDWFRPAFQWMCDQMAIRIPDYSGDAPVWFYTKRPSARPKDVRANDETIIRVTALIPRKRILISNYDTWHAVLNRWLHTRTEAEFDAQDTVWPDKSDPLYLAAMQESWKHCFDFTTYTDQAQLNWLGSCEHVQVQACVDRMYWNEIVAIRTFRTVVSPK